MIYGRRFHGCRTEEYLWHGHRLVTMENELLRVGVLASKGADILEFRYKPRDLDVFWHAPQPLLPPGQSIPTIPSKIGAFMDYYTGGWQEIFPNASAPAEYKGAELGVHGEVALLPWDVRVIEDRQNRIEIEFSVETMRTPFRLVRRMILNSDSAVLRLEESATNLGETDLEIAWGHHPAFGPPFLEEGCLIELGPCDCAVPDYTAQLSRRLGLSSGSKYPYSPDLSGQPTRVDIVQRKENRTEDVVIFTGFEDGWCALRNPRQKLAVGLTWDRSVFPFLWCWQLYGGRWGYPYYGRAHAVALEPFTCPILSLPEAVEQKLAPVLRAGGTLKSRMEASVFEAASKISHIDFDGSVTI
jgi:galactose mutarotase-like enzyme